MAREPQFAFFFDGTPVEACEGDSIAAALLAGGIVASGTAASGQRPRGPFCMMGACQECIVLVDGRRIEACRVRATAALRVQSTR